MHPTIFKAYDIRGIYSDELDETAAMAAAIAFVRSHELDSVVVGSDARASSPDLKNAVIAGFMGEGVRIIDVGMCTTPMLYFAVNYFKTAGGIQISASHNPPEYNGLKLVTQGAQAIGVGTGLEKVYELMQKSPVSHAQEGSVTVKDVLAEYVTFLTRDVSVKLSGKVVVDTGNGMVGLVLPQLLEKLQVDYTALNLDVDLVNPTHIANPMKQETLEQLQQRVVAESAVCGIAFDADGDRLGVVDEAGAIVRSDIVLCLLAQHMLQEREGGNVVYDLRSSKVVPEIIKEAGGKSIMGRVGRAYTADAMRQHDAMLGAELAGHFFFPFVFENDISYFDSATFAMAKLFEVLSRAQKPLSELVEPFMKYAHSSEINFEVPDALSLIKKLTHLYQTGEQLRLDGLTVTFKDWWFNVRPSNTEPVVRLVIEADTEKLLQEKVQELTETIQDK